jgi:hypothetical protein
MKRPFLIALCLCIAVLVLGWVPAGAQSLSLTASPGVAPPVLGFIAIEGAASSGAQVPLRFPVGTKLTLQWDPYTAAELTNSGADRFEVELTGPNAGTATLAITSTAFPVPTLAIGSHSISVKGCNPTSCSPPAALAFTVDPIVPPTPRNPRLEPTPEPVSLNEAALMAHAYKTLLEPKRPQLSDPEMQWLVARWVQQVGPDGGPVTLTRGNVLSFLDRMAIELTQR